MVMEFRDEVPTIFSHDIHFGRYPLLEAHFPFRSQFLVDWLNQGSIPVLEARLSRLVKSNSLASSFVGLKMKSTLGLRSSPGLDSENGFRFGIGSIASNALDN